MKIKNSLELNTVSEAVPNKSKEFYQCAVCTQWNVHVLNSWLGFLCNSFFISTLRAICVGLMIVKDGSMQCQNDWKCREFWNKKLKLWFFTQLNSFYVIFLNTEIWASSFEYLLEKMVGILGIFSISSRRFRIFRIFPKGEIFFFIIYLFFQLNSIFCVFVAGSWSSFRNRIDDRTTIPRTQMRFNCIQGIVSGWSLKERVVCSKFGESQTHTHTCLVGWAELSLPWTHMQFFWTKRNCTMTNAINVSHPIGRRCWQRLRTFFSQLYTHWICLPFHSITWTFHEYSNGNG